MKVNRFSMSQKIFSDMVAHWFGSQLNLAQAVRLNGGKDDALKILDLAEEIANKTFLNDEPRQMKIYREMLMNLRQKITLELSAQVEDVALSSLE